MLLDGSIAEMVQSVAHGGLGNSESLSLTFYYFSGCNLAKDITQQIILLCTNLSLCKKLSIRTHWCPL